MRFQSCVLVLLSLLACKHASHDRSSSLESGTPPPGQNDIDNFPTVPDAAVGTPADQRQPLSRYRCPIENSICITAYRPHICRVLRYRGIDILPDQRLQMSGANECVASLNLAGMICGKQLDPGLVLDDTCVPIDPDVFSTCQTDLAATCPSEGAPTVCSINEVNQRSLDLTNSLRGWGSNECEARKALRRVTCLRADEPGVLGPVTCAPTQLVEKCPLRQFACARENTPIPMTCSVNVPVERIPHEKARQLTAFAESRCLAEAQLRRFACALEIDPDSFADGIECSRSSR